MILEYPDVLPNSLRNIYDEKINSAIVSRAPGRIEIVGNHTDYNGGLVLTSTIDQFVWTMGVHTEEILLHSIDYSDTVSLDFENLDGSPEQHWSNYAKGVFWAFRRRNHSVKGFTGVIHGNIPQEGGLSSSAALEVSLVNIISEISKLKILPKAKAMLAYEAERLFCGISCGIMDQFTSQLGKPNSLLGIHCGNMLTQDIAFPKEIRFIVVNSMISRSASSILNDRRAECLDALSTLQEANWDIHSLSSISPNDLQSVSDIVDEVSLKRVTHIVNENQRVRDGISAIKNNDLASLGKIMVESHNSSRDLFEVSHQNLELLMNIAQQKKGILGCRLTGAGLGGNLLLLAKQKTSTSMIAEIIQEYERETGLKSEVSNCTIPGGVITEEVAI